MYHRNRFAFTLVELAVVLAIMGLIGVVFYGAFAKFAGKEKEDQTEIVLESVRESLTGQAVRSGSLPDPRVSGSNSLVPAGFAENTDDWGGDIRYWLAGELYGGASVTAERGTSLDLEIYDDASNFASGSSPRRTIENVAYVIASLGPNRSRQIYVDKSPPDAPTLIRILTSGAAMQDGSGDTFDDMALYATLNEIKAKVTAVQ
jgi:prepilin-type N-terminal cleavage/methylation domain-containing protein